MYDVYMVLELRNPVGTQILQIYWIYKDAIDVTSSFLDGTWKVRFRQTFFSKWSPKLSAL